MSFNSGPIDVLCIGNAIVDILARVEDDFLFEQNIIKSSMTLIDEEAANALYDAFPQSREISGGSAANTAAGIGSFGGKAAFMGKVAKDMLGRVFTHDLRAQGVQFDVSPLENGPETARCLVAITPDAHRSMSTYLGASSLFGARDLDQEVIRSSAITYMEGYLFDREPAKQAFVEAAEIARSANRKTAITLSDLFCVDRHRASFLHLIRGHMDIVFANEPELLSLYQTTQLAGALDRVRVDTEFAVITMGANGSLIIHGDEEVRIPATPVDHIMDTTGAGDLYAAGVLYGLAAGLTLDRCGELGAKAAAEIISHYGARPEQNLSGFLQGD